MGRKKGGPKFGGRVKGVPNKSTQVLGDALKTLKFDPVKNLIKLYDSLPYDLQVKVNLAFIDHLYPKVKALEIAGAHGGPIGVELTDADKHRSTEEVREDMKRDRPT